MALRWMLEAHRTAAVRPISDTLLEFRGSGGNESDESPENEATQNGCQIILQGHGAG
jgi:hypothetical protein